MQTRYAVLGLARPRAKWFGDIGRWASSGATPIDFVRCVGAEEVKARLAGGRPFSAVLVDGSLPAADRDLFAVARDAGCAPFVVDGTTGRDWTSLGAAAVLPGDLSADQLLAALETHATGLADVVAYAGTATRPVHGDARRWSGRLVTVTGPGGTGASLVAMGLAQHLGDDPRHAGHVLLADLALRADQALLHGSPDVVPGVSELAEAHRTGQPDPGAVRASCFDIEGRGYQLLLGLRRPRDWAALRPSATAAMFDSLLGTYRQVVADVTADVEGESDTGSVDVEERNSLARLACARASVVVVVGLPGLKGLHSLRRVVAELAGHGVPADRLVTVLNRAPRSPRLRAELVRTCHELLVDTSGAPLVAGPPVFVGRYRNVETALRAAHRIPDQLGGIVAGAVEAVAARAGAAGPAPAEPVAIRPGSLGLAGDDLEQRAG